MIHYHYALKVVVKLIFCRKALDPERAANLVLLRDALKDTINENDYKPCSKCPKPPHKDANYNLTCTKHKV